MTTKLEQCGPYSVDGGPTLVSIKDGTMFSRRLWVEDTNAPYKFRHPEPGERVKYLFSTDRDEQPSGEGIIVSVMFEGKLPVCMVLWSKVPVFTLWDPQF